MNRRKFLKVSGVMLGGLAVTSMGVDMLGITTKKNYYLQGNYAPVKNLISETGLKVTGQIPKDLSGLFVRNGPNPMGAVNEKKHHWFLGEGMLHGIRLDSGNALWYKNKLVDGNDSNANTSVISHGGKIYAIVEAGGYPVEIDQDLNSLNTKPFYGNSNEGFTAHPKIDPDTNEMHAMCYDYANNFDTVNYVVIDQNGSHKKTQSIPFESRSMMHECAITKNYMLVFDLSVVFDLYKLGRGYFPFSWDDNHQSRIGLLSRNGDSNEVKWFEIDRTYFFHTFNAHEDANGNVIVTAAAYGRLFDTDWNGPFTESPPQLTKWELNTKSGQAISTKLDDRSVEFPRINPSLVGKSNRYAYALASSNPKEPDFNEVVKYDFKNDTSEVYEYGPGKFGAEPVFVAAEGAKSEDEGYLLSLVYNQETDKSDLIILNAKEPKSGPLATIHLPQRVPYGFHGEWVNI
jgi:carotenoid cleavage dioxygenase